MSNWTKGPWVSCEHGIVPAGASNYSERILVSGVRMPMGRDDEAEANANLIAAAPELYEALSELIDHCDDANPWMDLSDAKDALAKARGEKS